MGATLQRQMIGSRTGLLVAATVSPYIKPPDDKEKPTKIIFKNRSQKKLKIKVDADRQMDSIVKNGWSVDADLGFAGVGIGGKGKSNNTVEYEAYHIVDTSESFSTVHCWGQKSFYPPNDDNLHAFITIQSENPDGSWLMIAENHSILKRCNVAYSDGSTNESRLPGIHVNHRGVDQIIPSFNGKYAKLEEDYKLGLVQVSNRSNFEVLVKVDSECINTKKMKSEIGGSLQGEVKSFASKLKLGGEKVNEVTKNVYYRANQRMGYTYLGAQHIADYYLQITNDTYYVSVDYIKNGKVVEHQKNEPYKYYSAKGIPLITIYEHHGSGDIIVVECDPDEDKDINMGSVPDPIHKKRTTSTNKELSPEEIKKYFLLDSKRLNEDLNEIAQ